MAGTEPSYIVPPWERGAVTYDEVMANRENTVRLEKNINQRALWNENLEKSSLNKRIKGEAEVIKTELRLIAKASLAVRRVALKQLMETEFEIWEKELSLQGKTFYKQRI